MGTTTRPARSRSATSSGWRRSWGRNDGRGVAGDDRRGGPRRRRRDQRGRVPANHEEDLALLSGRLLGFASAPAALLALSSSPALCQSVQNAALAARCWGLRLADRDEVTAATGASATRRDSPRWRVVNLKTLIRI